MRSNKAKGALWLIAAPAMLLIPTFDDGNKGAVAVGIILLILGVRTLRQKQDSADGRGQS
jgi:hypothetical protein